jgi:DNA-binding response OmpR family regulator
MLSFFSKKWKQAQDWIKRASFQAIQRSILVKENLGQCVCRILCVDDDRNFCLFIQRLAHSIGIKIDAVYSIQEAKRAIEDYPNYQAFIIDGHLPDGSGFEIVAWIREKKELKTPIAFISRIYKDAKNFRILRDKLKVDYVLEKPILSLDIHQLLMQLCRLTSQPAKEDPFSDDLLAELKVSYQKTISDKVERLENMILAFQKNPTIDHLQALKGEVHKIAGSAGSYGYMAVSDLCKNLELDLIKQIDFAKTDRLDRQWLFSLDDYLTQIKLHFQIELPESDTRTALRARHLPSVYIVDEDQDFLSGIEQPNLDQNFEILTQVRPEKAIETLSSTDFYPQILLFNAHYPSSVLTGYDLLQAFYQKNDYSTTITALIIEEQALEDHVEALQKGMIFVFTKPLSMSLLLPLLDQTPFRPLPFPYKILVIDEDLDICQYILKTLKFSGLEAIALYDLHDLEKQLVSYHPDLIVLNVNLTDEAGISILDLIRKKLEYKKLMIGTLSVTAQDMHLIQRCYDANVDEIILKPLEGGILQRKIAYLLRKESQKIIGIEQESTTGWEDSKTLKHYLNEWQFHSQDSFPKTLVIFEVEGFASLSPKVKEEILVSIMDALPSLLKKYDLCGYLGEGRFALVFRGYERHFIQLFMSTFLSLIQSNLKNVIKSQGVHINECLLMLSAGEKVDDILQRGEKLLQVVQEQQPKQLVRMKTEEGLVDEKAVLIFHDETQPMSLIKDLFEAHAFKVTLFSKLDDMHALSFDSLPLVILTGTFAEAKGLHLLKKLVMHNQMQIPILYFSHSPKENNLKLLLNKINYFEKPFSLVIFMENSGTNQ